MSLSAKATITPDHPPLVLQCPRSLSGIANMETRVRPDSRFTSTVVPRHVALALACLHRAGSPLCDPTSFSRHGGKGSSLGCSSRVSANVVRFLGFVWRLDDSRLPGLYPENLAFVSCRSRGFTSDLHRESISRFLHLQLVGACSLSSQRVCCTGFKAAQISSHSIYERG